MKFGLGVIEGFYGSPYGRQTRLELLPILAGMGYAFFLYAPKADRHLRGKWRQAHPDEDQAMLEELAEACHAAGLRFGVGLSPLKLHEDLSEGTADLARRAKELTGLGIDHLAILFDDMHSAVPDLANTQGRIVAAAAEASGIDELLVCPSYYSDQAILDKLFGQRPEHYLRDLGRVLDPAMEVFWTGPKVCSPDYPADHLDRVNDELGRKVLLWDNYPVNDGPRMCKKLHLRAFEGRGTEVASRVSGFAVNPMNQGFLSMLVLHSLPQRLSGDARDRDALTAANFRELLTSDFAEQLIQDVPLFMDEGLDHIDDGPARAEVYDRFDHPAAAEVAHWLRGLSVVGPECLTDTED